MPVIYSQACINFRLLGVVAAIGNAGHMHLLSAGGVLLASMDLQSPCGTVAGGMLTFSVPAVDANSPGGGSAVTATVTTAGGAIMISGLTVGAPLSGMEVIINNGLNSTLIQPTQVVSLVSGQIIGS